MGFTTKRLRAFTLIEMVLVLAILALAYALVPPLLAGAGAGAELKGATRQIAAGLRKARNAAVRERSEAMLTLDLAQHAFSVTGDTRTYRLPPRIHLTLVTAQREVLNGRRGAIRFYPDGSSNGGRVTLSNGARSFAVDVEWLTGRVSVLE